MHSNIEENQGVTFRYSNGRLRLLLLCIPASPLFAIVFYEFVRPRPSGVDLMPYFAVGVIPVVALMISYIYMRRFSLVDFGNYFTLSGLSGSRSIYYKDVENIIFKEGYG